MHFFRSKAVRVAFFFFYFCLAVTPCFGLSEAGLSPSQIEDSMPTSRSAGSRRRQDSPFASQRTTLSTASRQRRPMEGLLSWATAARSA